MSHNPNSSQDTTENDSEFHYKEHLKFFQKSLLEDLKGTSPVFLYSQKSRGHLKNLIKEAHAKLHDDVVELTVLCDRFYRKLARSNKPCSREHIQAVHCSLDSLEELIGLETSLSQLSPLVEYVKTFLDRPDEQPELPTSTQPLETEAHSSSSDPLQTFESRTAEEPNVPQVDQNDLSDLKHRDLLTEMDIHGPSIPDELREIFQDEADDYFTQMYALFEMLNTQPEDRTSLESLRRVSHGLKGASGAVGYQPVCTLAHRMEDLLDHLFETQQPASPEIIQHFICATDLMQDLVQNSCSPERLRETASQLDQSYQILLHPTDSSVDESELETEVQEEIEPLNDLELRTDPQLTSSEKVETTEESETAKLQKAEENSSAPSEHASVMAEEENCSENSTLEEKETGRRPSHSEDAEHAAVNDDEPISSDIHKEVTPTTAGSTSSSRTGFRQDSQFSQMMRVPLYEIDGFNRQLSEMIIHRTMLEDRIQEMNRQMRELGVVEERLRSIAEQLEQAGMVELKALSEKKGSLFQQFEVQDGLENEVRRSRSDQRWDSGHLQTFDTLEFDRYNENYTFWQILEESTHDLNLIRSNLNRSLESANTLLTQQDQSTRDLQDKLLHLRLIPLNSLSNRLGRVVREVSQHLGKKVQFQMPDCSVGIDKYILDELTNPLIQIIRNAVDHGIESKEIRQTKNKPEVGSITLNAWYQGSHVMIEIADDGAGLDLEGLCEAALQREWLSDAELKEASTDELIRLLFLHGVSTAEEVTEISGRGVGMDCVYATVRALHGTIQVKTEEEQGTTFLIRLPMTFSAMRVLFLESAGLTFAVPVSSVLEVSRIDKAAIEPVSNRTFVRNNDQLFSFEQFSDYIHIPDHVRIRNTVGLTNPMVTAITISTSADPLILQVDRVTGTREVVIKTLGHHLNHIEGVIGATILGNGQIVPVLNPGHFHEENRLLPIDTKPG